MRIDIITAFPDTFNSVFRQSITSRAQTKGLVKIAVQDRHHTADDRPFGGGPGMVLMIEPIYKVVESIKKGSASVYFLSPQGKLFNQKRAEEMAKKTNIILICGHYEGVDERVIKALKAKELSIGDYVLSGGEIAAMVVTDTLVRLVPGVLGDKESLSCESFSKKRPILDYPNYTRPRQFKNFTVPKILLEGNHQEIQKWRDQQALSKTKKNRPDLLNKKPTT